MSDADRLEVSRICRALDAPCSAIYVERKHRPRVIRLQDTDLRWFYLQVPPFGICGIPTVFYTEDDPHPSEGPWKSITQLWLNLSDGVIPLTVVEIDDAHA